MSLNLNATFVGSSSDLTASQLYAGLNVDFAHLGWFESQWMAWYIWIGNPLIATGIASFILHEVRSLLTLFRHKADTVACADRLFRSLHTVDHHRCYPIFPQVEVATEQDTYTTGAVGVY
jgi:hypothetical protein